jgi:hypothetical protein
VKERREGGGDEEEREVKKGRKYGRTDEQEEREEQTNGWNGRTEERKIEGAGKQIGIRSGKRNKTEERKE